MIEDAIAQRLVDDVLHSRKVRKRIKDAGPQEKAKFDKEFPEFVARAARARSCAA